MFDISNGLGNILQNKMQKLHQQNLFKMLASNQPQNQSTMNDTVSQGLGNGYSISQSPSLNLGDLLSPSQQNAVTRSVGRTPVNIPQFSERQTPIAPPSAVPSRQLTPAQIPQPAQRQIPANESLEDKKHRLLLEREEHKAKIAREKEERAHKNKVQLQIDKETLPFYKKIKSISSIIPEVDARLDEMEELLNTGNVQWFGFLDSLSNAPYIGPFAGAIEQAASTNESQVFKKLSTDFLRDAKPYFGSNMSTSEVKLFLQRVPSLMLSNEGNRALIRNFRALNEYSRDVDAILEGIIAENGGERPRHLESKLQARLKPATEKLKKSFRDSVKLIPKAPVQEKKRIRPAVAGGRP